MYGVDATDGAGKPAEARLAIVVRWDGDRPGKSVSYFWKLNDN